MDFTKYASYLLFLIFFIVFVSPVKASENFKTDLSATYTINQTDTVEVVLDLTLTNISENKFPNSYQLYLNFDNISGIKAEDGGGRVETVIEKTADGQMLELSLNNKPIGLDKKTNIRISFGTKSILKKTPSAVEINIPGVSDPDTFGAFDVIVKAPDSFGKPSYVKPFSADLKFSKNQISKSGILIAYGHTQIYKYSLTYHLKNPNFYPRNFDIALIPDTSTQEVLIDTILPRPQSVSLDEDGNWIAVYRLAPLSAQDVEVKGFTKINLSPKPSAISAEEKKLYTQSGRFWQSEDPNIRKVAKDLQSPEAIYNYVVDTLTYDHNRVYDKKPRLGASAVLSNPTSAVCLEFTDLFIALARASNIPAREINGYAFTNNYLSRPSTFIADVLHAWPEYYDLKEKTWISVDPTWGNTTGGIDYFKTLDLNHIAFVTKGVRGDFPIPAGGYKSKNEKGTRDIDVKLASDMPRERRDINFIFNDSNQYIAGLPIKTKIIIKNQGNKALKPQRFVISSSDLSPSNQATMLPAIPPFGEKTVEVEFDKTSILTKSQSRFKIAYADNQSDHKINVSPFYKSILGGIIIGISSFVILIFATKARRIHFFR